MNAFEKPWWLYPVLGVAALLLVRVLLAALQAQTGVDWWSRPTGETRVPKRWHRAVAVAALMALSPLQIWCYVRFGHALGLVAPNGSYRASSVFIMLLFPVAAVAQLVRVIQQTRDLRAATLTREGGPPCP